MITTIWTKPDAFFLSPYQITYVFCTFSPPTERITLAKWQTSKQFLVELRASTFISAECLLFHMATWNCFWNSYSFRFLTIYSLLTWSQVVPDNTYSTHIILHSINSFDDTSRIHASVISNRNKKDGNVNPFQNVGYINKWCSHIVSLLSVPWRVEASKSASRALISHFRHWMRCSQKIYSVFYSIDKTW